MLLTRKIKRFLDFEPFMIIRKNQFVSVIRLKIFGYMGKCSLALRLVLKYYVNLKCFDAAALNALSFFENFMIKTAMISTVS